MRSKDRERESERDGRSLRWVGYKNWNNRSNRMGSSSKYTQCWTRATGEKRRSLPIPTTGASLRNSAVIGRMQVRCSSMNFSTRENPNMSFRTYVQKSRCQFWQSSSCSFSTGSRVLTAACSPNSMCQNGYRTKQSKFILITVRLELD